MSQNPSITWDIVCENPDKPWDWLRLSENPSITWEIIQANLDRPWNWSYVSRNPNVTFEIIQENPNIYWNWYDVSANKMTKAKNIFICRTMQRWFSQSNLKEEMMAKIWHPRNIEKFKYLDPERFGGWCEEEEGESESDD